MSLVAATKRFIALGAPLALLILVPALQSAAGIAQFALSLFLFFTAITNDRRQGLHDKWANSLVIRSTTSGDGAVVVGCLVLIVIVGRPRDHPVHRGVCRDGSADRGNAPRTGADHLSEDGPRLDAAQRDGLTDIDPAAFRAAAHAVVDVMADYLDSIEDRPVFPSIEPGSLRPLFPAAPPEAPEPLDRDPRRLPAARSSRTPRTGSTRASSPTSRPRRRGRGSWARC